ncbi:MAG: serine/threonine protein kinase [Proteobacteria bacterium]|nr:serine/threonine protein kinase [Pseudomonadota bacterium]
MLTDRRGSPAIYKTLRRLGTGGMAEVFLARQEGVAGFRRLAVVKRLLPQFSSMSSVAEMLLDEARIAAQLSHPNIVQIYELGQEEDQYFIAMEYVDGCDLATLARIERRRKSRVPMRLVLRVVSEAAQGLDYAHRQAGLDGRPLSLVHRDVSPHNILCSREGAVKVTDFGIAKAVGKVQVTEVGVVKGKVHYMSPEQYTGDEVDKRSDVFSLGVVLYQLTTGRLPRVTRSGQVNMRQVAEGIIPPPSELRPDYPAELEKIVMCALANAPGDRYQDCAGLRDDLLNFGRDHDLIAFPKELGDYVSALVPPLTLTEEAAKEGGAPSASAAPVSLQSVARGTERVATGQSATSPGHRNISALRSLSSLSEDRDTEIPIQSEEPRPAPSTDPSIVYLGSELRRPVVGLEERLRERQPAKASPDSGNPASGLSALRPAPGPGEAFEEHVTTGVGPPSSSQLRGAGPGRGGAAERPRIGPPPRREERTALERPQPRHSAERGVNPAPWVAVTLLLVVIAVAAVLMVFLRREDRLLAGSGLAQGSLQQPSAGGLDVWSKPEAAVFVDGAQRCARTPCSISGLPLGRELLVTVRGGAGYSLWVQRAVLTPQQPRLLLEAVLMPEAPGTRSSAGKAAARDSSVAAGSSASGKASAGKGTGGEHPARAATEPQPGSAESAKRGSRGKGKVSVGKAEGADAILASDVRPGWAEVFVDDKSVGHTPLQVTIEAGRHVIELKNQQFGFHAVYRINARPGTKTKITDQIAQPQSSDKTGDKTGDKTSDKTSDRSSEPSAPPSQ